MTPPYEAIIMGKRCKIAWSERQENLILVDGIAYEVGSMNLSLDVLRKQRVVSISDLKFSAPTASCPQGMGLVDGKHTGLLELEAAGASKKLTYHVLGKVLSNKPVDEKITRNWPPLPNIAELRTSAVAVLYAKDYRHSFNDGKSMQMPIFLSTFKPSQNFTYVAEVNGAPVPGEVAHAAAHHLKSAAADVVKQIRSVNSELQGSAEQLAEVAQPFREMYKTQRLAGAKSDALKAGIPELVVDSYFRFYHLTKLPTTDVLVKYLNESGFSTKLESEGHGTSRATVGRWLKALNSIMRRLGLSQGTRFRANAGNSKPTDPMDAADQSDQASPDNPNQERPEDSDDDEQ